MRKIKSAYVKTGLMIFAVGLALIAAYFSLHNTSRLRSGLETINDILMPFYIGIIVAYLLSPIYNAAVRFIYRHTHKFAKNRAKVYHVARLLGSLVALGTLLIVVGTLFYLVIPDLIDSIIGIINQLPDTVRRLNHWFVTHIEKNPQLVALLSDNLQNLTDAIQNWAQTKLLPGIETILNGAAVGVINVANFVVDVVVALVICVYILNSKEMFQAQAKKFILSVCSEETAGKIFELGHISNDTFGGFISGKVIDSLIIGLLCFVAMSILRLPMAMLISVIVGVTNIIPFFGPFIGAIPSVILLLIVEPMAALKFIIMIFILQQVDGNIIGPKILGNTTGLSSFWVMFAIIVGGGLFGFPGMILGVPLFAIFYVYVARFVNGRLKRKGYQSDTIIYEELSKFDIDKEDVFGRERCNPAGQPPGFEYMAGEVKVAEQKTGGSDAAVSDGVMADGGVCGGAASGGAASARTGTVDGAGPASGAGSVSDAERSGSPEPVASAGSVDSAKPVGGAEPAGDMKPVGDAEAAGNAGPADAGSAMSARPVDGAGKPAAQKAEASMPEEGRDA